jgi:hypothetical protein
MSFFELSELLGNWGEFIGAIAVVLTLIYLATQVRQNSHQIEANVKSLQLGAYQDLMNRIADVNKLSIESAEVSDIIRRGGSDPHSLDDNQINRYCMYLIKLMRHADMAYLQFEQKMLDEERYRSALGPFLGTLRVSEFSRRYVTEHAQAPHSIFTVSFKAELNRLVEETEAFASERKNIIGATMSQAILENMRTDSSS